MKGFGTVQPKILGMLVAAFVAGATVVASPVPQAIAAVIATDVQCTGCVNKEDLAASSVTNSKVASGAISPSKISSNAVTSAKIADGTITAADIATDAVGADELQGLTKLQFTTCSRSDPFTNVASLNSPFGFGCPVNGLTLSDKVIASRASGNHCFAVTGAEPNNRSPNTADVFVSNICGTTQTLGDMSYNLMIYSPG